MDETNKASDEPRRTVPVRAASQGQLASLRSEMYLELRSLESRLRLDIDSVQNEVGRVATHDSGEFREARQRIDEIALNIRHLNDSMREIRSNDQDALRRELANLVRQLNRLQSRITTLETMRRP